MNIFPPIVILLIVAVALKTILPRILDNVKLTIFLGIVLVLSMLTYLGMSWEIVAIVMLIFIFNGLLQAFIADES